MHSSSSTFNTLALRRAGRFDREIVLGAPDEAAREGIIRVMTSQMRLEGTLDYRLLAKKTPGFVGADVRSLTKEAAVIAINRIFKLLNNGADVDEKDNKDGEDDTLGTDAVPGSQTTPSEDPPSNDIRDITPLTSQQLQPLYITMDDFLNAIPNVQPSSKREGFATVPDVSWSDIGALAEIREELTLSVLEPIAHPEKFEALGLPLPAGVLLYGPPGCGKTLLAKAIANESGANFISVKGPELLDKYVGESERSVRVVFERARSSSPCIIFFDELDSLCPKRGSDGGGGGGVSERVVNQLLTEMDGLDSRRSVFVIAATNRPELIDPAMLRPGRLDKLLYVPLPSPNDRLSILRALSKKIKLASDVNLETIAHDPHSNGFSGADCAALLREAGLAVLRDGVLTPSSDGDVDKTNPESKKIDMTAPLQITAQHFKYAFDHVLPSVSKKDQARYDRLRERMARARTRGGGEESNTAKSEEEGGVKVSDVQP
jgi:ribosome biogenesis ATPase